MKVGVLAVQGAFARHRIKLEEMGVGAIEVRTVAGLDDVDAIVFPGGESTTMSMMLERTGMFEPLAARLSDGMPAFGTCAGMILLAAAIVDGRPDQRCLQAIDIDVRRNAFGRQIDSFETDLDVTLQPGRGPESVHAVFIRAPVVTKVGPEVEVLAEVDGKAVACRQGSVIVTAFHPELAEGDRIHRAFLDGIP